MSVPPTPLCRRRLLLLGATAAGGAACGEVVHAPTDAALDAAPDAPSDAAADVPRDVARDTGPAVPRGYVRLGPVTDFPLDRWVGFDSPEVIVGRDAAGLFAYSASCTHWGCVIPAPEGPGRNSVCPCHFAQFDGEGRVRRGPAAIGLEHFPLRIVGGDLYVNPRIHVPDDTRTPV